MEPYNKNLDPKAKETKENPRVDDWGKGRIWAGLIIIAVGSVLFARELGAEIPRWIFSWPVFLIALGFFIGARHSFRNWYWLIPVLIGSAFLVDRIFWEVNIRPYIWPIAIVIVGLIMIFKPKRKDSNEPWIDWQKTNVDSSTNAAGITDADTIESVAVFGSTKKNILSKNFRGGEVVNFFGGTELNLAQADITGPIMLELTQVFGGAKLIVPANWRIQSELVSVFGGVDDKRMIQPNIDPTKVLVLKGTNVFGGLEIKSF